MLTYLYEHNIDGIIHLVERHKRYYINCVGQEIKEPNKNRDGTRCKTCFGPKLIKHSRDLKTIPFQELYSWNVESKKWQKTNNIGTRVNQRLMLKLYKEKKTPIVHIDCQSYYYLGVYSSYDELRKKELNEFYLFKRVDRDSYELKRNITIDRIEESDWIDFSLAALKKKIKKDCKTYDDELKMSYIFNMKKCI